MWLVYVAGVILVDPCINSDMLTIKVYTMTVILVIGRDNACYIWDYLSVTR